MTDADKKLYDKAVEALDQMGAGLPSEIEKYVPAWIDGYKEGLKVKINTTTISDCPVEDEWHYPSKGELPNCTRQVLICYGMEERMKFVYWRADLGTFGSALPIEITAWRYIEPPKEKCELLGIIQGKDKMIMDFLEEEENEKDLR